MSRLQTYGGSGFIGGGLPRPVTTLPLAGNPQQIQAAYNQTQQSAAGINDAIYGNVMAGYQNVAAGQRGETDLIGRGYVDNAARARQHQAMIQGQVGDLRGRIMPVYNGPGMPTGGALGPQQDALDWATGATAHGFEGRSNLYRDAMADVEGLGRTERMDIQDRYGRMAGRATQDLASRGLGNTTVSNSIQRGIEFDRSRAGIALQDALARERLAVRGQFGLSMEDFRERRAEAHRDQQNLIGSNRAQYEMGLGQMGQQAGLAGMQAELGIYGDSLAHRERANMANTSLAGRQLDFMGSVQAPYPDANAYMALAQMAGQAGVDPYGGGLGAAGGGGITTRGPMGLPPLPPWLRGGGFVPEGGGGFGGGAAAGFGGPGGYSVDRAPMDRGQIQQGADFYGNLGQSGFGGGVAGPAAPAAAQFDGSGGATPYSQPSGFGGGFGGYGAGGGDLSGLADFSIPEGGFFDAPAGPTAAAQAGGNPFDQNPNSGFQNAGPRADTMSRLIDQTATQYLSGQPGTLSYDPTGAGYQIAPRDSSYGGASSLPAPLQAYVGALTPTELERFMEGLGSYMGVG